MRQKIRVHNKRAIIATVDITEHDSKATFMDNGCLTITTATDTWTWAPGAWNHTHVTLED